jgi:putative hydroxymethylpyrimidine transport system permease protein
MLGIRGIIITIGLLLFWQLIVWLGHFPAYILPTPLMVAKTLVHQFGLLLMQTKPTLIEIILGLFFGVLLGSISALALVLFKPLHFWLMPILIISQAIPTFALAPLLVIWFGYGLASKVAVTTIMIFFPVVTTLYDGLNKTTTIWLDLAKTMNASRLQILWRIQIPAALPSFASGLRVAAAIAPIGAIVGEWVGASRGLGFLMLNANARMQINVVFAALVIITIITLLLYFVVDKTCRKIIWWK